MRHVIILLLGGLIVGAVIPRITGDPEIPDTSEAQEVKARAERLYSDMSRSDGISGWMRSKLIVQRVTIENYQEMPGSCSGFSDQPKADPAYDRYVDVTEVGLFGIELKRWHAVCGGRIPLTRQVIVASTKAEWERRSELEQLDHCKKNNLPCGHLGDFRTNKNK